MTALSIPDMSCGHCKATVEKAIHALDPQAALTFDMAGRKVEVQSTAAAEAIRAALEAAGYPATPA